MKRALSLFLSLCLVFSLCSCGGLTKTETQTDQTALPNDGETVAVMHTSLGDIWFRLFPDDAPKAVDNFIGLAESGKYRNLLVFRSEANYLIQSGDYENNDGTGGKSRWGGSFNTEVSSSLHNLRGALGMARASSYDSCGSQFYVVTRAYASVAYTETLRETDPSLAALYEQQGGIPEFDGEYTVFGQAYAGLDVLDALNAAGASEATASTAIIESVEITTYHA